MLILLNVSMRHARKMAHIMYGWRTRFQIVMDKFFSLPVVPKRTNYMLRVCRNLLYIYFLRTYPHFRSIAGWLFSTLTLIQFTSVATCHFTLYTNRNHILCHRFRFVNVYFYCHRRPVAHHLSIWRHSPQTKNSTQFSSRHIRHFYLFFLECDSRPEIFYIIITAMIVLYMVVVVLLPQLQQSEVDIRRAREKR